MSSENVRTAYSMLHRFNHYEGRTRKCLDVLHKLGVKFNTNQYAISLDFSLQAHALRRIFKSMDPADYLRDSTVQYASARVIEELQNKVPEVENQYRVLVRRFQAFNLIPWTVRNMEQGVWNNEGVKVNWRICDDPAKGFVKTGQDAFSRRRYNGNTNNFFGMYVILPMYCPYGPGNCITYKLEHIGVKPVSAKTIFEWIYKFYQEPFNDHNDINLIMNNTLMNRNLLVEKVQQKLRARIPVKKLELLYDKKYPDFSYPRFDGFIRFLPRSIHIRNPRTANPDRFDGNFEMKLVA